MVGRELSEKKIKQKQPEPLNKAIPLRLKQNNRCYLSFIKPLFLQMAMGAPSSSRSATSIYPSCSSSNSAGYTLNLSAPELRIISSTATIHPRRLYISDFCCVKCFVIHSHKFILSFFTVMIRFKVYPLCCAAVSVTTHVLHRPKPDTTPHINV